MGNNVSIKPEKTRYTVHHRKEVTLKCTIEDISGDWIPSITWKRRKKVEAFGTVTENIGGAKEEWNENRKVLISCLTIKSAAEAHAGFYNCLLHKKTENLKSADMELNVLRIIPVQTKYEVNYKMTTTLECKFEDFSSSWKGKVIWKRRGKNFEAEEKTIKTTFESFVDRGSIVKTSLEILNAEENDSGFYSCKIHFDQCHQGTELRSDEIELCVYGLIADKDEYAINLGNTIVLKCRWIDMPMSTSVNWRKNHKKIESVRQHKRKHSISTKQDPHIVIYNSDLEDAGLYECRALYSLDGWRYTPFVEIHLNVCAFRMTALEYTVDYGRNITLKCDLIGSLNAKSVSWQRTSLDNTTGCILIDGLKYKKSNDSNPSLVIVNANENDTGYYFCTATIGENGELRGDTVSVCVQPVQAIRMTSTEYFVANGKIIILECVLEGISTPMSVFWQKRKSRENATENIIIDGSKYIGSTLRNPSLVIANANQTDSGSYFCTATIAGKREEIKGEEVSLIIEEINMVTLEYKVSYGTTIALECILTGSPNSKLVCWHRRLLNNTTESIIIDGSKYKGSTVSSPSLVIVNANENDTGFYFCTATLGGNEQLRGETVSVCVQAIRMKALKYVVGYGKTVILECDLVGSFNPMSVLWQKRKSKEKTTENIIIDDIKYKGSTVRNPSLVITNIDQNDSGSYVCTIAGEEKEIRGDEVSVTEAIKMTNLEYSVDFGTTITLECILIGSSKLICWRRHAQYDLTEDINTDGRKYRGSTVNNPSLVIVDVNENDSGSYFCTATVDDKELRGDNVSVCVKGFIGNLSVMVTQKSYNVKINGSVNLKCSISGNPPPHLVYWTKVNDGTQMPVRRPIHISNYSPTKQHDNVLTIEDADDSDDGVYKCIAVNQDLEIQSEEIHLFVLGGYRTVLETFILSTGLVNHYSSFNLKYMPDAYDLKKREKYPQITDINKLKVGMHVCFARTGYKHHGIVTNVMTTKNTYEVIHMTGDSDTVMDKSFFGIGEIRKEQKCFNDDNISYYDYKQHSIDNIHREIQRLRNENSEESIVSKRACLLYEAIEIFRYYVYYELFSFNCEHFASYCATGLAFCKQKDMLATSANVHATALLDKILTVYCEEQLGRKPPSNATLKKLQESCLAKNNADMEYRMAPRFSLNSSMLDQKTRRIHSVQELKAGMEIIVRIDNSAHHAVVTNVCFGKQTFEVIHLSGVDRARGEPDCHKLMMTFHLPRFRYYVYNYDDLSIKRRLNVDGNIIKLRACILHKIFHTIKDLKYDRNEFNCDHFSSYCAVGSAYSKRQQRHNEAATKTLDKKLIEYCARFISLPE